MTIVTELRHFPLFILMHVHGQAKHAKRDFFDEQIVHGHTQINLVRKLTKNADLRL